MSRDTKYGVKEEELMNLKLEINTEQTAYTWSARPILRSIKDGVYILRNYIYSVSNNLYGGL